MRIGLLGFLIVATTLAVPHEAYAKLRDACAASSPTHPLIRNGVSIEKTYDTLVDFWRKTLATAGMGDEWRNNPLQIQIDKRQMQLGYGLAAAANYPHHDALVDVDNAFATYYPIDEEKNTRFWNIMYLYWNDFPMPYNWIIYSGDYVQDLQQRANDSFAPVVLLAHEFGHRIQQLVGRNADDMLPPAPDTPPPGKPRKQRSRTYYQEMNRELDADRIAGAFLGAMHINRTCFEIAKAVIRLGGDRPDAQQTLGDPHGTSDQRAACLEYGFVNWQKPFYNEPLDASGKRIIDPDDVIMQAGKSKPADCKTKTACNSSGHQSPRTAVMALRVTREATQPAPLEPSIVIDVPGAANTHAMEINVAGEV